MSKWGAKNGLPGYDEFRTGLTYRDVWEMFRDDNDDRGTWRYKRRGTVLGHWHEIKLQLYNQMLDRREEIGANAGDDNEVAEAGG
ncbi:MAG TPA: hypothetical protein VIV60_04445 [Polyangiaceae bacterium]